MARTTENTTYNNVPRLEKPFTRMCGEVLFKIKDESTYTDQDTKQQKISPAGIFLHPLGMAKPIKISARSIVQLYHTINDSDDIKTILRARMAAEPQPAQEKEI